MSLRLQLRAGELSLSLAPDVGGSIASYELGGRPLMRGAPDEFEDAVQGACFPLVPYSNRVRDGVFRFRGREMRLAPNLPPQRHPLHGVGWRGAWRVESDVETEALLAFDWPGGEWPWAFHARQRFTLTAEGLQVALTVENASAEPMPAGLGLHPFFPCPAGTVLDAEVADVFTVDDELFPDGREPAVGRYALGSVISGAGLDNGYGGWGGEATIRWPDGLGLRIRSDERWFQVYAPTDQPLLAAEPVSHANGALNAPEGEWAALGLEVLEPGESKTLTARFDPVE